MTSSSRIFSTLEGSWRISRTISGYGAVIGTAVFTKKEESELHYREEGDWMTTLGTVHRVYREYIYRQALDGEIGVYFADQPMKLLHPLQFDASNEATGEHVCNKDSYQAKYVFVDDDCFTLAYIVKGPEKDYTIYTEFTRSTRE